MIFCSQQIVDTNKIIFQNGTYVYNEKNMIYCVRIFFRKKEKNTKELFYFKSLFIMHQIHFFFELEKEK